MNEKNFNNEMQYQLTMSYVSRLKRDGIISDEEYKQIDTIMLKRHRPVLGTLLSGNKVAHQ